MGLLKGYSACRVILIGACVLSSSLLWGQPSNIDELERRLQRASDSIQAIEGTLSEEIGTADLDQARARLVTLRSELDALGADARSAAEVPRARLGELGSPPAEGEPPEPDNIAELRRTLTDAIRRLDGVTRGVSVASADVTRASERAEALRSQLELGALIERRPEVFTADFWREAVADVREVLSRVSVHLDAWAGGESTGGRWMLWLVLGILLLVVARLKAFPLTAKLRTLDSPSRQERLVVLAADVLRATVVAGFLGFFLYDAARSSGLVADTAIPFARIAWLSLTVATFAATFGRGYFSPRDETWRCCLGPKPRLRCFLFLSMAMSVIVDSLFQTGLHAVARSSRAELALSTVTALLGGLMLFVYARVVSQPAKNGERVAPRLVSTYRVSAIVILVAVALAYVRVAHFLFQRLTLVVLFIILVLLARTLGRWALVPDRPLDGESQTDTARSLTVYWLGMALDVTLGALSIPLFLLVVGFNWIRIQAWVDRISAGITIGPVTLSLSTVLGAIVLFLFVVTVTRAISSWIDSTVLEHTKLDEGSRQSILTLGSYVGFLVAVLISLGIIGVDMSSLAVVAGALSVGIGFGLQGVVNNFVSGIVLLFERPIRPGDWISLPSGEGIVVRTTVRSTEIQTFDRATIIVPNSELITSAVTNWTYGGKVGRTIVKVGVSYASDPEKVKKTLLDCAARHPRIHSQPAPYVLWQDFGESSLDFELRAFVRDVNERLTVTSELRFAIFDALKKAGIEIPFPQRDLHVIDPVSVIEEKNIDSRESQPTKRVPSDTETG